MDRISLDALLAATGGVATDFETHRVEFDHVGIDSRQVQPRELFWAIKGERHDGHKFANEAIKRGAAACLVESNCIEGITGPKVVVDDTTTALHRFARWYRNQQEALVVGVTGSVGKTTTREMIYAALSASHTGTRSEQNYNNRIGVPLSILDVQSKHEFAVLELAASRIGEIRELAQIAEPEIGVVTAVCPAHLDGFGSIENIIQAKGELIETLPNTGFAVLAGDDVNVRRTAHRATCPVLIVGERNHCDLRATHVTVNNESIEFRVDAQKYELPVVGRHHLTAALCAIAVGREIGLDTVSIATGLTNYRPQTGRCMTSKIGDWTVVDDTYNANPASMHAACRVLKEWRGPGRRILVTGDMLELGENTERFHYELGATAAAQRIDYLAACGLMAGCVVRGALAHGMPAWRLVHCENVNMVETVLDCWLEPNDVLLVKGSRGMRMEQVVEWIKERAAMQSDKYDKQPVFARAA